MAATVKASKPANKRPMPPREPEADQRGPLNATNFEPVRLETTHEREIERVPLFSIDGREYTIEARPRMNIGLEYLHLSSIRGEAVAIDWLLGTLLGEEGYRALRDYDELTTEQFQQITEIAARLTLGALEAPKE